jgi:hypothetical protein
MTSSMAQFRDNRMGSSHYVSSALSPVFPAVKEDHKASIIGTNAISLGEIKLKLRYRY